VRRALAVILLATLVMAQPLFERVELQVYESGYVKVTEVVLPPNYTVVVEVPLIGENLTGLAVMDGAGRPLLFERNGTAVLVYITNSTDRVVVTYYTPSLTRKEGPLWVLSYSFPHPVTVRLPEGAIIVELSDVPLAVTKDSIVMPPGNQSLTYILPAPTPTTHTPTESPSTTPSTTTTTQTTATEGNPKVILALLPLLFAGVLYYLRGRRREMPLGRDEYSKRLEELGLNEDEIKALLYVYDRGGKAKQADVRKALGIPKTTAWRMFKRLEERGLVRVYKRGKENWVELVF